jgi:hypothetical protein
LFDLGTVDLATGMERLRPVPFCQALDRGDILGLAEIVHVAPQLARQMRNRVGDCGACRLFSCLLARQAEHGWIDVAPLSARELAFYRERVGADVLQELLRR